MVEKLVIFKIGKGDFDQGFPLILQIGDEGQPPTTEMMGKLPPAPEIPQLYEHWQSIYRRLGTISGCRIAVSDTEVTNVSIRSDRQECDSQAQILQQSLNHWLRHPSCLDWREQVLLQIKPTDQVRGILQTENIQLRRLPWHLWELWQRYPHAEIALGATDYHRCDQENISPSTHEQVNILAIFGNNQGINTTPDQAFLQQLPTANLTLLQQPTRTQLNDTLWKKSWDILFFAGHTSSQLDGNQGILQINSTELLTIEQLRYGLTQAVNQGLKLAIFNSCDGLGLAQNLADLKIPQIIIMREPVPDLVAQAFLQYFLEAYSQELPFYQSVRQARERLQGWENQFPCATWLPIIWQNLAYKPLSWSQLAQGNAQVLIPNLLTPKLTESKSVDLPNIGQSLMENTINRQELRYRQILLSKVKQYWVKGVLETSLHGKALIELGLEDRQDAVEHPWGLIWEHEESPRHPLPPGTRVTDKFDELGPGRSLLILGEPGAGKTTTLLELARDLIQRTEQHIHLPIPIIFNLSSWHSPRSGSPQKTDSCFADWLVREFHTKYQVAKDISTRWIESQNLLLLLDGLDEVNPQERSNCVASLNQFLQQHGQTEVIVCCRISDYESLPLKLQLMAAIYLQPLTLEQIQTYLSKIGSDVEAIRISLETDTLLQQLAKSPLILSIITLAYQGLTLEDLPQQDLEKRREHLFNKYIDRMFKRKAAQSPYSQRQARRWLIKLAHHMVGESQTVFLIERIQPSWLETKLQRWLYAFTIALMGGIVGGLGVGISVGMISGTQLGLLVGGTIGLAGGLGSGIILTLAVTQIEPVETLKWSWQKAQDNLMAGVRIGILSGILYMVGVGILFRLVYGLSLNILGILSFGLSGLNIGIMYILLRGLTGGGIETSTRPNQGMWMSAKNALFFALIGVLTLSIVAKFVTQSFFFGATVGLVLGLFSPATIACVQHLSLRLILTLFHYTPWNYARFLDYGTQLIFLQKVGGGYIFIHRLLLEHFAKMKGKGFNCG